MAITVIEIPKVILSLSLESGGDLPDATTYYFTGWIGQGAGYYGGCWGEAADQVSITTTAANQQIRIDWSYWHDGTLYEGVGVWNDLNALMPETQPGTAAHRNSIMIKWDYYSMLDGGSVFYKWCNLNDPAISDEFQDGYGHRRWMQVYSGNGIRADYKYANLTTMNPANTSGTYGHGQLAWRYNIFDIIGPWPMEKSDLLFQVDGTGNTEQTLIDCIEGMDAALLDRVYLSNNNDFSTNNAFNIIMKGSIGGLGEISYKRMSLITVSSTQILNIFGTYEDCYISDNQMTQSFWLNLRGNSYTNTVYFHVGNAFIIDYVLAADNFRPWARSGTTSYASIIGMYIEDVPQHQWRYFKPTMPITDSTFKKTVLTATAYSISHDYTGVNAITWTNVKFLEMLNNWDVAFTYYYIIDPEYGYDEINAYGLTVDRPDGKLRCRWTSYVQALAVTSIVNVFQPLNLTVKDKDGVEIVGATVAIIDNTGFQYSDVTDINGEYSENIKSYSVELDPLDSDGYGNDSKTIDFNDLKIFISANGYQVYEAVFSIYEELSMEVALIEEPEDPDASGLTNAYETEAMRHLFLNEPILNIGNAGGLLPSTVAGDLYIALLSASPGEAGSLAAEATYTGYVRIPVPRTADGWTEFLGKVRNYNQVNFNENTGPDETLSHYAVMKELTGSEMVAYGELDEPLLVYTTAQPQFAPTQLEFNID
jgi:hypothetical protein